MDKPDEGSGRRHRRPRRGIALAVMTALLLVAAACGGDDDEDSSSGSGTEDTSGGTDVLGPENAAEGEPIKVGMVSDGATRRSTTPTSCAPPRPRPSTGTPTRPASPAGRSRS